VLLTSCANDEQCRQNRYIALKIDFFHVVANKTRDTITTSNLVFDSITVKGLKYDTLTSKYTYADSVYTIKVKSTLDLLLHKFSTVSKFEIRFNKTIDTLTVIHTNSNYFLSLECGCLKNHYIDSAFSTNHFQFDSIRISNPTVNTSNAENIRIYK
jgi:hypothetical protein